MSKSYVQRTHSEVRDHVNASDLLWGALITVSNTSYTCIAHLHIKQVNKKFHKLERGYRDCIKMTRDKTRIYSIPHDAPGT